MMYLYEKPIKNIIWGNNCITGEYIIEVTLEEESKTIIVPTNDFFELSVILDDLNVDKILITYLSEYCGLRFTRKLLQ